MTEVSIPVWVFSPSRLRRASRGCSRPQRFNPGLGFQSVATGRDLAGRRVDREFQSRSGFSVRRDSVVRLGQ